MLVCSSSQDGSSYPIILHYYRVYINIQNTSSKCIDHNTVLYYCSLFIIPHHVIYHHIMYINMSLQCVVCIIIKTSYSTHLHSQHLQRSYFIHSAGQCFVYVIKKKPWTEYVLQVTSNCSSIVHTLLLFMSYVQDSKQTSNCIYHVVDDFNLQRPW